MSIRTASRLPSTLTCKLQAHYIIHEPPPTIPNLSPNHWLDGTHLSGMLPAGDVNVKKPRVGGAELGGTIRDVRLAPPLRSRCDGDHKNALFCRVLQEMAAFMTVLPLKRLVAKA